MYGVVSTQFFGPVSWMAFGPSCCFVSSPVLNSWMEPPPSMLPGSVNKPCHQDPALPAMLRPCELCPSVLALLHWGHLASDLPLLPALAVPHKRLVHSGYRNRFKNQWKQYSSLVTVKCTGLFWETLQVVHNQSLS